MKGFIRSQATIYNDGAFYTFGSFPDTDDIARLDAVIYIWSLVGRLNAARRGASAIVIDDSFLVVGGWSPDPEGRILQTEKCTGGNMTCTEQGPGLDRYEYFPLLLAVPDDFCKTLP